MAKFYILAVVCILGLVQSSLAMSDDDKAKIKDEFMEIAMKCMQDLKVPQEDLENFKNHKPATTKEGKCVFNCVMEQKGTMSGGKVDVDALLSHMKEMGATDEMMTQMSKSAKACEQKSLEGSDACAKADIFTQCMMIQHKEMAEMVYKVGAECVKTEKVDAADIELLKAQKMPTSHNGICFFKCLLESFNVMVDGKITKEGLIESGKPFIGDDPEKLKTLTQIADECVAEVGAGDADPCVTAKMMIQCTHKRKEEMGIEDISVS